MEKHRKNVGSTTWCVTCCTRHTLEERCPGELAPTGPEQHGWRANVETSRGVEAYGVLTAPCDGQWRSRIITYPNVLWLAPGSRGTMKFVGDTSEIAEANAKQYISEHLQTRGLELQKGPSDLHAVPPAERKIRFLQVGFGVSRVTESGGTGNLSESGLYIITDCPMEKGTDLNMNLDIGAQKMGMQGSVVWMRRQPHTGRTAGMGVFLEAPSQEYVDYVRSLA